MRSILFLPVVILFGVLLGACGAGQDAIRPEDRGTRLVVLPDGGRIRLEIKTRAEDILRGAMFRERMPEDRGLMMLFTKTGTHPTFLYQVRFPLDIVWLDEKSRIVEIAHSAPPCPEGRKASECPAYGSRLPARTVLHLAGGVAKKHNLMVGTKLDL
jgi:uncharacterized protein